MGESYISHGTSGLAWAGMRSDELTHKNKERQTRLHRLRAELVVGAWCRCSLPKLINNNHMPIIRFCEPCNFTNLRLLGPGGPMQADMLASQQAGRLSCARNAIMHYPRYLMEVAH